MVVLGGIVGSVVYSELQVAIPALGRFHESSSLGRLYLWDLLHLPPAVVGALVALLATGAFIVAGRIERSLGARGLAGDEPSVLDSVTSSGSPAA